MNPSDNKDLGTINDMINRTATELSALLSMRDQIVLKNAGSKPSIKEMIIVTVQVISFVLFLSVLSSLAIGFLITVDVCASALINGGAISKDGAIDWDIVDSINEEDL